MFTLKIKNDEPARSNDPDTFASWFAFVREWLGRHEVGMRFPIPCHIRRRETSSANMGWNLPTLDLKPGTTTMVAQAYSGKAEGGA